MISPKSVIDLVVKPFVKSGLNGVGRAITKEGAKQLVGRGLNNLGEKGKIVKDVLDGSVRTNFNEYRGSPIKDPYYSGFANQSGEIDYGMPLSLIPIGYEIDVEVNGVCEACTTITPVIAFVKSTPQIVCYRNPDCVPSPPLDIPKTIFFPPDLDQLRDPTRFPRIPGCKLRFGYGWMVVDEEKSISNVGYPDLSEIDLDGKDLNFILQESATDSLANGKFALREIISHERFASNPSALFARRKGIRDSAVFFANIFEFQGRSVAFGLAVTDFSISSEEGNKVTGIVNSIFAEDAVSVEIPLPPNTNQNPFAQFFANASEAANRGLPINIYPTFSYRCNNDFSSPPDRRYPNPAQPFPLPIPPPPILPIGDDEDMACCPETNALVRAVLAELKNVKNNQITISNKADIIVQNTGNIVSVVNNIQARLEFVANLILELKVSIEAQFNLLLVQINGLVVISNNIVAKLDVEFNFIKARIDVVVGIVNTIVVNINTLIAQINLLVTISNRIEATLKLVIDADIEIKNILQLIQNNSNIEINNNLELAVSVVNQMSIQLQFAIELLTRVELDIKNEFQFVMNNLLVINKLINEFKLALDLTFNNTNEINNTLNLTYNNTQNISNTLDLTFNNTNEINNTLTLTYNNTQNITNITNRIELSIENVINISNNILQLVNNLNINTNLNLTPTIQNIINIVNQINNSIGIGIGNGGGNPNTILSSVTYELLECNNNSRRLVKKENVPILFGLEQVFLDVMKQLKDLVDCIEQPAALHHGEIFEEVRVNNQLIIEFKLVNPQNNAEKKSKWRIAIPSPVPCEKTDWKRNFEPMVRTLGTVRSRLIWKDHQLQTVAYFDNEENAIQFMENYVIPLSTLKPIKNESDLTAVQIFKHSNPKRRPKNRTIACSRAIFVEIDKNGETSVIKVLKPPIER